MGKHKKGGASQPAGGDDKKAHKKEDKDFDAFLKELSSATARSEPQHADLSAAEAKARRKKKAHDLKEAKEEQTAESEIVRKIEAQRQQEQFQRIMQLLQSGGGFRSEILEKPITEKEPLEEVQDEAVHVALCGMQGWRRSMEDAHAVRLSLEGGSRYFAVFDGHVGNQCAVELSKTLPERVASHEEYKKKNYQAAFSKAYVEADEALRPEAVSQGSGCTAVSVLLTPDRKLVCANVGDSRAVLSRGGKALDLSTDHKPELPEESKRIAAAGGHVSMNRVNGQLAMSRAMGDFSYKKNTSLPVDGQLVIPNPEVTETPLTKDDEFLIVACDGVWDVLSSQAAVDRVREMIAKNVAPLEIVQNICDMCCCPPAPTGGPSGMGTDNVSVVLVIFKPAYKSLL